MSLGPFKTLGTYRRRPEQGKYGISTYGINSQGGGNVEPDVPATALLWSTGSSDELMWSTGGTDNLEYA